MHNLISDKELNNLAEEFHVLDSEISYLIRLLCCVREFREDVASLSGDALKMGQEIDVAVAIVIIQRLTQKKSI